MDEPATARIERALCLLGRSAERFGALSRDDSNPVMDRAAYRLLGQLYDNGPARLTALGATFSLDISTVSRQVAALTAHRLVERTVDPTDRRAIIIRLTDYGRERYESARRARVHAIADLTREWKPEEVEQLAGLLCRLNAAIEDRGRRLRRQAAAAPEQPAS